MRHITLKRWLSRVWNSLRNSPPKKRHTYRRVRLGIESLEDRTVPSFGLGDLAVLDLAAPSVQTTGSILELSPSTANQGSPIQTIGIPSTGSNALLFSNSGTSSFLSDSNDGSALDFGAYNTTSFSQTLTPTNATWASGGGGVETITVANTFIAGNSVTLAGFNAGNGTFTIATASGSKFTYDVASNPGITSPYGTATSLADLANDTAANVRAVGTVSASGTYTLGPTYTESTSGDQTRSATTTDDSTYYITDKGGLFTNGATTSSIGAVNILDTRTFGGVDYISSTSTSLPVNTASSPTASSLTGLPGLSADGSVQDFYMIQSGSSGSTYDILYTLDSTGAINKYSLVGGTWMSDGTITAANTGLDTGNNTGGLSMIAAKDGSGAYLYVIAKGTNTSGNSLVQLTDTGGYDQPIAINSANDVTLYTATSDELKGLAFVPQPATATTTAITSVTPLSANSGQSITFTATVTANSGGIAPTGGIVEFFNGGTSGTLLATATTDTTSGTTATFTVSTTAVPAGTYNDIQAFYVSNTGFSNSNSSAYGSTLTVSSAISTTTTITSITPLTSNVGTSITFTATVTPSSGLTAPGAGTVKFYNGGTGGTLLATASTETTSGTTATFTVSTTSIAGGTYNNIEAFYTPSAGFGSSNSSVYGSTLQVNLPNVIAQWSFPSTVATVDNSPAPTYGTGTATTLGITNSYNSGSNAGDDILVSTGTANTALSEETWRVRGSNLGGSLAGNGWATAAAGAAEYTQGAEFDTYTGGASNVHFSFDWQSTGQGVRDLQVQYNTNVTGAGTWVNYVAPGGNGSNGISTAGTYLAPNGGDFFNGFSENITVDLSSAPGVSGDANELGVRLVSAFDSTGGVNNGSNAVGDDYAGSTLLSTAITGIQETGTTVTVAMGSTPPLTTGQLVTITGVTPSGYDGTFAVVSLGTNSFTYSAASGLGAATLSSADVLYTQIYNNSSGNWRFGNITFSSEVSTTSAITASPISPQQAGATVSLTDTITPASGSNPTGTVQFYDGYTPIGSPVAVTAGTGSTGVATLMVTPALYSLAIGTHTITAQYNEYAGDNYADDRASITDVVSGVSTTSVVTPSAPTPQPVTNTSVTFTDDITPASGTAFPTGTVKFYNGAITPGDQIGTTQTVTQVGSSNVGSATIAITTPVAGTYNITAVYSPTGSFAPSNSTAFGYSFYSGTPGPFTPGNLVLLQAGDGVNTYADQAPVFLDEITTSGSSVQQVPIPDTAGSGADPISAATETGTTVTITTQNTALFANGEEIAISGIVSGSGSPSAWDGTVPITVLSSTQFTYTAAAGLPAITSLSSALATPPNQALTIDLTSPAGVGQLNRSYDGTSLSFAGVDSTVNDGGTGSASGPSGTLDRDLAVVTGDPTNPSDINTATYGPWNTADDNRGAVAESAYGPIYQFGHQNDSGALYAGVHVYTTEGGPSTGNQVSVGTTSNIRGATIGFDNRMYFSSAAGVTSVNAFGTTNGSGIFTEPTALPTASTPTPSQDIEIVPNPTTNGQLGGIFFADVNGTGIMQNGDRLYFVDNGTKGGAGTGGLYVATWNTSNDYSWNTPNNAAAAAAGIQDYWGVPVRLGDAPIQTGSNNVGQMSGLTGTVLNSTTVELFTSAFDQAAGDSSIIQEWTDSNTGVSIANAQITSGSTVEITTATPNNYTTGEYVSVDGITTASLSKLSGGFNGTWQITRVDSTHFTYTDTNSGASGLAAVANQGGADVAITSDFSQASTYQNFGIGINNNNFDNYNELAETFGGTIVQTLAEGSDAPASASKAEVGLRGISFAPVAATSVVLTQGGGNLTATLTNAQVTPSGEVTFINESTGTVLGQGTISASAPYTATLPSSDVVGDQYVEAYFAGGGTAALASATSSTIQVLNAGGTSSSVGAAATPTAVAVGTSVTLTATVTTGATGNVSFYNTTGGAQASLANLIGTSSLSGATATLTTSFGATGAQTITAIYNGNSTYASSQNTTTVTVAANATVVITPSANNVALNSIQTYTATITGNATLGTPGGSVVFNLVSADPGSTGLNPAQTATTSSITVTPGANDTATAVWTGPALAHPGSYLITMTYTPTGGSPYSAVDITTTSALGTGAVGETDLALIETVKQAFKPGDLVAVQRGDGTVILGSSGQLVFLDEYTPSGALVQSIALPNSISGSNNPLLLGGQNGSQGLISLSADGYYLTLTGYDASVGETFLTSTFPFQVPRTIAEVNGSATVNTSTAISSPSGTYVPYEVADAISIDGNEFYLSSSLPTGDSTDSGVSYVASVGATSATQVGAAGADSAALAIAGGQLYNVQTNGNVEAVGAGLPTTSGQTLTGLPNLLAAYTAAFGSKRSPEQVLLLNTNDGTTNDPNVAYIGDQVYGLLKFWLNTATITTLSDASGTVTVNDNATFGFATGDQVEIAGASNAGYDGIFTITNVSPTSFTYTVSSQNLPAATGGAASEWIYGASGNESNLQGYFGQKLVFAGGVTGVSGYVVNPGPNAEVQLYVTGSNTKGTNPNQIDSYLDPNAGSIGSGNTALDNGFGAQPNVSGNLFTPVTVVGASGYNSGTANGNENFAGLAFVPGYVTDTNLTETGSSASGYALTATVTTPSAPTNVPTGVVYFYLDGSTTPIGSAMLNGSGVATLTVAAGVIPSGSHTVTAAYQGDVKDGTSTGVLTWNDPPFTSGNLIATVVNTTTGATNVNEYTTAANQVGPVQSIALPSTGSTAFTEGATATTAGYVTDSSDGHSAVFAGYNAAAGSSTTGANAIVAVVNPNGSIDTSTEIPVADTEVGTSNSVRAVASADGLGFYVATNDYIQYVPLANNVVTPTTAVSNYFTSGQYQSSQSPNDVAIGSGSTVGTASQLYGDAGSAAQADGVLAADGPFSVGSGLPTNAGQAATIFSGFATTSSGTPAQYLTSEQFSFSPDGQTLIVADARTNGAGGVYMYQNVSGTQWASVASSLFATTGLTGLSVDWTNPAAPIIYAVTTDTSAGNAGNSIVSFAATVVAGGGGGSIAAPTTLATAPAGEAFRGVALAPTAPAAATTSTVLTVTDNSGGNDTYNQVQLSAQVTDTSGGMGDPAPTGWVSFQDNGVEIGSAPVNGGAATLVPNSNFFAGNYADLVAVYTGDSFYAPSTSTPAQTLTVNQATPSVSLTAQNTSTASGVSDTFTATIAVPTGTAPTPTTATDGTVTFWSGTVGSGTNMGTVAVSQVISGGTISFTASLAYTFTSNGTYPITAVYNGNVNFSSADSNTVSVFVVPPSTTVVTTSNASPSVSANPTVTLTATVTGSPGTAPTGTVTFYDDQLAITSVTPTYTSNAGAGTLTATIVVPTSYVQDGTDAADSLLPGLQTITAVWGGDNTYFGSTGVYEQAVTGKTMAPGDLFEEEVGDGTNLISPSSATDIGATIYINEYNTAGTLVQTFILPSGDGTGSQSSIHAIVADGQQAPTGQLTLSGNGTYLFTIGYDSNNPDLPANSATAPTLHYTDTTPRAVARISLTGVVQTIGLDGGTLAQGGVETGYNISGVYSPDGNKFYLSGGYGSPGDSGVDYFASFTPSAALQTYTTEIVDTSTGAEQTALEAINGNLVVVNYGSPQQQVEEFSGMPTTAQTPTTLPGLPASGVTYPFDVYFTHLENSTDTAPAGINTMYLTDGGTSGYGTSGGAIDKFSLVSGSWVETGTLAAGSSDGFQFIAGTTNFTSVADGAVTLYTTYGGGGNAPVAGPAGELYAIDDADGYDAGISTTTVPTPLATAAGTPSSPGSSSTVTFRGVAVLQIATTTAISDVGPNPSNPSQTVNFTVTVTPATGSVPNGEMVNIIDANTGDIVGSGSLTSGTVTIPISTLAQGTDVLYAEYPGDTANMPSDSSTVTQNVTNTTTTFTINSPASPANYGASVSFTVNVNDIAPFSGTPTGQVEIVNSSNSQVIGTAQTLNASGASGSVTFSVPATTLNNFGIGSYSLEAEYLGNGTAFVSNSATTAYSVVPVTTTTTVTSNNSGTVTQGGTVQFTATVVAADSTYQAGTVQFYDNGVALGSPLAVNTGNTNVPATYTASTALVQTAGDLTPGIHSITAVFTPTSTDYAPSTAAYINQAVQAQAFGAGDQLVYRVGGGGLNLGNSHGNAVWVDEVTPAGAVVQSLAMPTADAGNYRALVQYGQSPSNPGQLSGQLTEANGYVLLAGYDDTPTATSAPATDNALRTIARISASGVIQTETISNAVNAVSGSFDSLMTGIYSPDGSSVYLSGIEFFGIEYVPASASAWSTGGLVTQTPIVTVPGADFANFTGLESIGNTLYVGVTTCTTTGGIGAEETILQVGTAGTLPTSAVAFSNAGLPNLLPSLTHYFVDMYFTSATTMYASYEGSSSTEDYGLGGISKYAYNGSTWTIQGTALASAPTPTNSDPTAGTPGFFYISGSSSSGTVTLYESYNNEKTTVGTTISGDVDQLQDTNSGTQGFSSTTVSVLNNQTGIGGVSVQYHGVAAVPTSSTLSTTTTVGLSAGPYTSSSTITFTGTVTASTNPTSGTVAFYYAYGTGGQTQIGATQTLSGSNVATVMSTLPAGSGYVVTAVYTPGTGYSGSNGASTSFTVLQATGLSLVDNSTNSLVAGTPVSVTATLTGYTGTVTGDTVNIVDTASSQIVGTGMLASNGTVTISIASTPANNMAVGAHTLQADFVGDATNASSTSNTVSQTVNAIAVTSVVTNGDYIPVVGGSESGNTVTLTTNGNSGFTTGSTIVVGGYSGANAGYNGTWTNVTVSGYTITFNDASTGLPSFVNDTNGYAISANTTSALIGARRSMVDSIAYTFNTAVTLTAAAISLGVESSATITDSNSPGLAPNVVLTALNGGTSSATWVVTFVSGNGATVTGHSIADGAYSIALNSSAVTAGGATMTTTRPTDYFYRLFADFGGNGAVTTRGDYVIAEGQLGLSVGYSSYLADADYLSDGAFTTRGDYPQVENRLGDSILNVNATI